MADHKHVVVVGAGFGGLQAVKKLAGNPRLIVTLIDQRNHHLFQPLLYQVATAVLSPADIAIPARSLTGHMKNVHVIMGEVTRIDRVNKIIYYNDLSITYDYLILAMGAVTGYFGHPEWGEFTTGLKSIEDALHIRRKILLSFELAENYPDKAHELLNYIIIGGGPTGVELAGSIAELSHEIIRREFKNIDPALAKITLIEGGSRLLPVFSPELCEYTRERLEKRGVTILLNAPVQKIDRQGVHLKDKVLNGSLVIWAAGVEANPFGKVTGLELDRSGRIIVDEYCSPKGEPSIFVLGDLASYTDKNNGRPLPSVSPVAMQQGRYAAAMIKKEVQGKTRVPFHYIFKGNMATIGRKDAVAEMGIIKMKGLLGWFAWLFVHLYYQVGFKNRLSILITWIWSYITLKASARVIHEPRRADDKTCI